MQIVELSQVDNIVQFKTIKKWTSGRFIRADAHSLCSAASSL